jgi:iron complex outermembrane receptor protein
MLKKTKVSAALAAAFGGGLLLSSLPSVAQQTLERVEVTGSRIKRVEAETASPVQVLTREDIEKTGKQTIQEVLRGITADGVGSIPSSFTNGFASGSAAVSLRGLGVNSTLVLVNGRRMTTYGLADDGTRTFVDLNTLPLEAVDRIEVLKDGASAIYGADAVGGVVNVILRKSYTGGTVGGSYGQTGKSDGQNTRAFASVGVGNLDTDRFNAFLTFEASQQKNIWSKDRGFIGQSDLTAYNYYDTTNGATRPYFGLGPTSNSPYGVTRAANGGGARVNILPCDASLIDPTTGLCRYNRLDEQEVQPAMDRINIFGRGTIQISPAATFYTELGYFNTKTKSNGTLGANNDGGVFLPGDPFNPLFVHSFMILPAAHPDNTFGVDRALFYLPPFGGRDQITDSRVFRIVQGLQGNAFGWDYDLGAAYIKSRLNNVHTGYIVWDAMQAALNNGTFRISPTVANSADVLAAVSPRLEDESASSVKSVDFRVSRELMNLAGGPLGLALGTEWRQESAVTPAVPGTETASIVGLGYSAYSARRQVLAFFGELSAPVTKWLELSAAARYDKYSDFGDSTTPKLGFKIKPIDQVAIRGTYAEAFRAPGPAETGGSSFGFTTYGILSQGNTNIKPETAKSYTLGLIAEPVPGTSLTLDYWKVDRKNEIVQADPNSIIGNLPTTGTPLSRISGSLPGTFMYYDANGDLATVTGFYENAAKTTTDGIDLEVKHRMSLGEAGRLSGQLNWSHTNKYRRTDALGNTFDYAGTHGPLVQSAGGGSPKDRLTLALTWDRAEWGVTAAINYTGPIKMVDHKGEVSDTDGTTVVNGNTGVEYPDNGSGNYACGVFDTSGNVYGGCKLPAFTTVDLFAKWSPMKNLDINFSIQNLFDKKAPFDPYLTLTYGINYNQTWHQSGAVGRFFTVGAKYSF